MEPSVAEVPAAVERLVVFMLDDRRYALRLSQVERAVPAIEPVKLPKAPEIVLGVVNVRGRIIPVLDIRVRFGLKGRPVRLTDNIILAHTSRRAVGLLTDGVSGVVECPVEDIVPSGGILPGMEYVDGAVKLKDGLVLIHDIDTFLSLEEDGALQSALDERGR